LYCLDVATGREAWRKDVLKGPSPRSTVLFGGGHFVCLKDKAGLVAFDPATGGETWAFNPGYTPCGAQGPIRFSQAGQDVLLYGHVAVDMATGKTLWKADGANGGGASPCAGEGYVVFSGEEKKAGLSCYRLDADPARPPRRVWALEPKYSTVHDCTPVIYRGYVYTKMPHDGTVPGDIMYVAIDLATGKTMLKVGSHTDSHASMTAGDGMVFYEGHQFTAAPDFKLLPKVGEFMHTGDGASHYANSHTPPCVAGRLYIKGNNSIRCLDLCANP
jgi:outer membrane protein assembly factor BamB